VCEPVDNGVIDDSSGSGGEDGDGDRRELEPVLIVDDEDATRRLVALTLAAAGFATEEASGGEEALELLAANRYCVVLLDNRMPGMSGVEVVERLRADKRTRTLPVVLLTGDDEVADRVRGLRTGADDYLVKPFDPDELLARVEAQLRGQAAWNQVLEDHLRERATIATALGRIPPAATPERTAEAICAQLSTLGGLWGAAIVAFLGDGLTVPLAVRDVHAWGMAVGRPLPVALSRYLSGRARSGPWVERVEAGTDIALLAAAAASSARTVACAPLHRGDEVLGLLVLAADPPRGEASSRDVARVMASAIDFAAFAAGLLAPGLHDRRGRKQRLARLEGIMRAHAYGTLFQPIVRLSDLEPIGYEALTRFSDGERPDLRFAEAATLGVGGRLERAALEAALAAAVDLPAGRWVSINASPGLVMDDDDLPALLSGHDRPLVIELTEHAPVEDYERLRRSVERLGDHVRLSVDDAGSGFASLRHVLALHPAYMKLDHSWVAGVEHDPAKQALIAGLGHFAVETGCILIAEGIETQGELDALRRLDASLGQGFLLGQPATAG
jgi:EAL domain-containing protein (putative c-di-GMP-specific phosphodiesterase class I)/FixJ family two-component response regulator